MNQNCIQDYNVENVTDVTATISTLHIYDKLQCHQSEQIDVKHEVKYKDNQNTRRKPSGYTGKHFNYINSFAAAAFEVKKWDSFHSEE